MIEIIYICKLLVLAMRKDNPWTPCPNTSSANRQNQQISPASITANAFHNIAQIETSLWDAADLLRANSNLTATEYSTHSLVS